MDINNLDAYISLVVDATVKTGIIQQNQLQVMDSANFDFLQRVWGFSTFSCILVDTLGFFSNIFRGKNKTLLDLSTINFDFPCNVLATQQGEMGYTYYLCIFLHPSKIAAIFT